MVERRTVLVVSDDPGRSAQVRLTLGDDRAEVLAVGRGEVHQALAERLPDVVLVDLAPEQQHMPATTVALLEQLRGGGEAGASLPLIGLVTGEVDERLVAACSSTVRLPTTPFALLRRIDEALA